MGKVEKAVYFGKPEVEVDKGKHDSFLIRTLDLVSGTVMNLGLLLVVVLLAVYAISSH